MCEERVPAARKVWCENTGCDCVAIYEDKEDRP